METVYKKVQADNDYIFIEPVENSDIKKVKESLDTEEIEFDKFRPQSVLLRSMDYKIRYYAQPSFKVLQKWEGVVEHVESEDIMVKLLDITNGGNYEEAVISISDIDDEDLPLLKPGAMFYWNIGYFIKHHGQRTKASLIKFKRCPEIKPDQFDIIHDTAKDIESKIHFE